MTEPRLPEWATWNEAGAANPWTLGVEEEIMLLDPESFELADRNEDVLAALSDDLRGQISAETHGCAIELATTPHGTVRGAVEELAELRTILQKGLEPMGLRAAVAGTHPFAMGHGTAVSPGDRYREIFESMRELARREPTFAQHVHVAIPDAETATKVLTRLRVHLPLLLGLSANSPFWRGRDSDMASARTPVFSSFPRVGIPRAFDTYAEYVEAIDGLLRLDAVPEPTFVWWDVRLQPRLGTIEVRIMDAQTRIQDVAALTAIVQCAVRLESQEKFASSRLSSMPEVLAENRFLAFRDGVDGALLDPDHGGAVPTRQWVAELITACEPVAIELDCVEELAGAEALRQDPGYTRQRADRAAAHPDQPGRKAELKPVLSELCDAFTAHTVPS